MGTAGKRPLRHVSLELDRPVRPPGNGYGVTRYVLEAILDPPPDLLVLQTHTARVVMPGRVGVNSDGCAGRFIEERTFA